MFRTTWETIERNCTKETKCIIEGYDKMKNTLEIRKLLKYQQIYSMVEK